MSLLVCGKSMQIFMHALQFFDVSLQTVCCLCTYVPLFSGVTYVSFMTGPQLLSFAANNLLCICAVRCDSFACTYS